MKNADMPAYGKLLSVGDQAVQDGGLTKREWFAATMNHDANYVSFDKMETLQDFIGRTVDISDVQDIVAATVEAEVKVRVMRADALLKQLDPTTPND